MTTKKFKTKSSYFWLFILNIFLFLVCIVCLIDYLSTPEEEFVDSIMSQEMIGHSRYMRNIAIQKFIVSHFGAKGLLIIVLLTSTFCFNELYKTISEYRRLLFREKLIREGLRAPDDYIDDERPLSIWQKVKRLLTKKTSVFDHYSRKEIKNADKNMEEYKKRHKSV